MNVAAENIVYPLDEFYAARGEPMPEYASIQPAAMPEPARSLLVHQSDMTSTLEKFYGENLHIQALASHRSGDDYFREVVLVLDKSKMRVELGAIKINLALFPAGACEALLHEHEPLGHVLNAYRMEFSSRPSGFLRLYPDRFISAALQLPDARALHGRRNSLFDSTGRTLAEIVEILPS